MFSAGRLLSIIRTKLGHPAVFRSKEIANIMVSYGIDMYLLEVCNYLDNRYIKILIYYQD